MERDEETPFPRDAWQRLLRDRDDAPPDATDARIRASARRALAPRAARWWLPASLAASLLLAVLVVERQDRERETPAVLSEEDVASRSPAGAKREAREESGFAATEAPASREPHDPAAEERPAPTQVALPDAASESEVARSPVGGPERDLQESNEMPVEDAREEADETAAAVAETAPAAPRSSPDPESSAATGVTALQVHAAKRLKPEDWYADIEKLRAAGRSEEAERELERLEAAYPGWLAKHHPPKN